MPTVTTSLERRRMTALCADVVDYARHTSAGVELVAGSMPRLRRMVGSIVTSHDGLLVDFVGDTFLSLFDDPARALGAAVSIRTGAGRVDISGDVTDPVRFRMGLDVGDVVRSPGGGWLGDAINVAARIMATADPGGISMSERVYVALDRPELRLEPLGKRRLKNVPEMVGIYRLVGSGVPDRLDPPEPWSTAVAVLPLVHHDPASRRIADAVRLEVMVSLADLRRLQVIDAVPGVDHSDTTRAGYLLGGGAVAEADRLRVYLDLIETVTMNRVWAKRWEGDADGLFPLIDTVTTDVVRALEVELVVGEPANIYRATLSGPEVEAVYEGWYHFGDNTAEGWWKAIAAFESVATKPRRVPSDRRWPPSPTGTA